MESKMLSLPRELVRDILGRVASSSFVDLHSAKLCCKEFVEVAKEDYIHRKISLENLPIIQWKNHSQISRFLDKCVSSKNREALFRKGVVDYFEGKDISDAFGYLEQASNLGKAEACYAIAIILLFNGGESKQRGIKLLSDMNKSRIQKRKIKSSQQRLKNIIRMIWVKNAIFLGQRPICCTDHQQRRRTSGWDDSDENCNDDKIVCDACICDEEIAAVCDALPQTTPDLQTN